MGSSASKRRANGSGAAPGVSTQRSSFGSEDGEGLVRQKSLLRRPSKTARSRSERLGLKTRRPPSKQNMHVAFQFVPRRATLHAAAAQGFATGVQRSDLGDTGTSTGSKAADASGSENAATGVSFATGEHGARKATTRLGPIFFVHSQLSGSDQCHCMSLALIRRGIPAWHDDLAHHLTLDNVREGIRGCSAVVLFLSDEVLNSEFVRQQLREAIDAGKVIIPVIEADYDRGGDTLATFQFLAPKDIGERIFPVPNIASKLRKGTMRVSKREKEVPYERWGVSREKMLKEIARRAGFAAPAMSLTNASEKAKARARLARRSVVAGSPVKQKGTPRPIPITPKIVLTCKEHGRGLDQCLTLVEDLEDVADCFVMQNPVPTAPEVIAGCAALVVFVTIGAFQSGRVLADINEAVSKGKPIVFIVETDENRGGLVGMTVAQLARKDAPAEVADMVEKLEVIRYQRRVPERLLMLHRLLAVCGLGRPPLVQAPGMYISPSSVANALAGGPTAFPGGALYDVDTLQLALRNAGGGQTSTDSSVASWLGEDLKVANEKVLVLTGPPSLAKSAVVARMELDCRDSASQSVVSVFCLPPEVDMLATDPKVALRSVALQLCDLVDGFRDELVNVVGSPCDEARLRAQGLVELFATLIRGPLAAVVASGAAPELPVYVFVDNLDMCLQSDALWGCILGLAQDDAACPWWLRFVVSMAEAPSMAEDDPAAKRVRALEIDTGAVLLSSSRKTSMSTAVNDEDEDSPRAGGAAKDSSHEAGDGGGGGSGGGDGGANDDRGAAASVNDGPTGEGVRVEVEVEVEVDVEHVAEDATPSPSANPQKGGTLLGSAPSGSQQDVRIATSPSDLGLHMDESDRVLFSAFRGPMPTWVLLNAGAREADPMPSVENGVLRVDTTDGETAVVLALLALAEGRPKSPMAKGELKSAHAALATALKRRPTTSTATQHLVYHLAEAGDIGGARSQLLSFTRLQHRAVELRWWFTDAEIEFFTRVFGEEDEPVWAVVSAVQRASECTAEMFSEILVEELSQLSESFAQDSSVVKLIAEATAMSPAGWAAKRNANSTLGIRTSALGMKKSPSSIGLPVSQLSPKMSSLKEQAT